MWAETLRVRVCIPPNGSVTSYVDSPAHRQGSRNRKCAHVPRGSVMDFHDKCSTIKNSDFSGHQSALPEGCAKLNAHNRLPNLEFAIVEFDIAESLFPNKNSLTCTPFCLQATTPRLPPAVLSDSAAVIASKRDLWRILRS